MTAPLVLTPEVGSILWNSLDPRIGKVISAAVVSGTWAIAGHGNGHGHGYEPIRRLRPRERGADNVSDHGVLLPQHRARRQERVGRRDAGPSAAVQYRQLRHGRGHGPASARPGSACSRRPARLSIAWSHPGRALAVQARVGATWTTVHTGLPTSGTPVARVGRPAGRSQRRNACGLPRHDHGRAEREFSAGGEHDQLG